MVVAVGGIPQPSSAGVVVGNWVGAPSCRACSVVGVKVQPSVGSLVIIVIVEPVSDIVGTVLVLANWLVMVSLQWISVVELAYSVG